ncbi:D-alanyl-D-alanine carboxypeptidase (penicillin-binding protein 5/6) [Prosthecobacter fusiformis]|uniref:D-alanyl-D-alanine carboxypeptidase (Penicillin-binding protein 5/6) n=1 Tax=Prosthecobacter fusiformis TaxID=48464 RepID=A0A4R7S6W2_9BACT|nr:serine hydrolase [Prosthecobacter fusiformis]TDU72947.1 D-alanyl-D-alanine carboxypeptidase (penicillin-binding protein 5/6) [Prosthecobacter fusiformis]
MLSLGSIWLVFAPATASAQSAVLAADSFNRKIHVANQANEKRPVGGLAKIATAMVTLDWAEASKAGVNILATVPAYAPQVAGSNTLGLQPGDRLTLRDLIYATLMTADDIAAITLGDFVGRDHLQRLQRGGDPLNEFVRQMNQLAAREGASNTRFTNPHGFENTRTMPYSTAADMTRLGLYAISRPALRFYTNQRSREVTVYRATGQLSLPLNNTNELLGVSSIDGIKYTSTPRSGGCIVVTAERPASVTKQPDGSSLIYRHRMVVTVIGSSNPAAEAHALLQQSWAAYDRWLAAGRPITDKRQLLNNY